MIKEINGEWFICHARFGPDMTEPFASFAAAQLALDAMTPANRMLATGGTPYLRTDVEFLKDSENGRQFQDTPKLADQYKKNCEKAGGSVTGKKYLRQLAKFPGDPRAWVSSRGDVEAVARETGLGVEGLVNVKTPEVEPPKRVKVDKKIVERELKKALKFVKPGKEVSETTKQDMREAIIDTIGPKH